MPRVSVESGGSLVEAPSGTVTFLFTDLVGSTRAWAEHADAMRDALPRHDAILRGAIEAHRGHVVKMTGDGVHAAFAIAHDAVAAAVAAQLDLSMQRWPDGISMPVRMGLHAGESIERDGDYFGSAVNLAARLMAAAHGGQIVCSDVVAGLVADGAGWLDLGVHRLRDLESVVRVWQVTAPGLVSEFPPLESFDAYRSNLPVELSTFVGREDDVAAVTQALSEARVVSIVGVGGVGKTRLALRAASELLPEFADGVWLCELAEVHDADAIPEAVAATFGFAPSQGTSVRDGLAQFFRNKHLLLVLDNCEHLLGAVAAFLDAIAKSAARLSFLITSREALAIRGERTYPLASLDVPADGAPHSVEASEAGSLFITRASEARGSFAVTNDNAGAVRDLCTRLDGIPLAIELAAARTTMMSPQEIVERLDQRFRLLTGRTRNVVERHQTLHAAIDWSYELLDTREQRLLARLSVFVGDFDLDAATAMATDVGLDSFEAIESIGSLVSKSLVQATESDGTTRYRLLETIRQYAAEQLDDTHVAAARDSHASFYLARGRELFAMSKTARDFDALEALDLETPNLAAALRWRLESSRLADVFAFFDDAGWIDAGLLPFSTLDELGRIGLDALHQAEAEGSDGRASLLLYPGGRAFFLGDLEQLQDILRLARPEDEESVATLNARLCEAAMRADFTDAIPIAEAAVELGRREDDPTTLAFMLGLLAVVEWPTDAPTALAHAEEAVAVARRSAAPSALIYPLTAVALAAQHLDPERALAAARECVRIDRTRRRTWSSVCEGLAAKILVERGEVAEGLQLWSDVLRRFDWTGELIQFSLQLPNVADSLAELDPALAVQLAAIAESNAIAAFPAFDTPGGWDRLMKAADELGPEALEHARLRAATMSYDDAMAFVFDAIDDLVHEAG